MGCNILIITALGGQIVGEKAPDVNASMIGEGADGSMTNEVDRILNDKKVFIIPDILASAGGVVVSYFEWVQDIQAFFRHEKEINDKLRIILYDANHSVRKIAEEKNVTNRKAALMLCIGRVAECTQLRGLRP